MSENNFEHEGVNVFGPEAEIEGIIQQVYALGANDSEIPTLRGILQRLKSGEIDKDQAVREARAIEARKMDYH